MNMVTVKINGIEYNLKGEEREEYLHRIAAYVDKKIKSIMSNNPKLSTTSSAVLAAVNCVDDLFKSQGTCEELQKKLNDMKKQDVSSAKQIEDLKEEIKKLHSSNEELTAKLNGNEMKIELKKKQEDIEHLKNELKESKMSVEKYADDYQNFDAEKKELKFQLQSARYKIINLQNKLMESQIELAKYKKLKDPLINEGGN
ncbi:cell division protein ZapA [Clostridium oryzae]|uniref:Cell division protein ZapA n=1 Tax=Clostridium oryzae TaxID=1450648 RepID=A0A1V4IGI1_9CLOT|nr:cell division protein ZapA [Clostridium oryzae]OPJ59063.1 cell division protein ZapA [Clostridium oryzae]